MFRIYCKWIYKFASSYEDVASIKDTSKSHQSEHLRKRCVQGQSWRSFEARIVGLRAEIIFFAGYPYHSEKNKCGQLICSLERTTANAACSSFPPTGRPMSLSIWWFDVGWKIRTPHNKQRGLEQRDWNRETEGRKGRTIDRWTVLWLKMAAVFTADYEGLYSIHRKAVGVVCDSAQQNQELHSKVNQKMWCLLESLRMKTVVTSNFPLYCLSFCYVCYRFFMSVPHCFCCVFPLIKSKAHHSIWPVNVHPMVRLLKTSIDWRLN